VSGKGVWAEFGSCSGDDQAEMGFFYFVAGVFEGFGSGFLWGSTVG